jgi:hypothetical protein
MLRNLKEKTRRVCLIVLGVLLLSGAGALAWITLGLPHEKTKEVATYKYNQNASINYRVHLLPNEFFTEPSLGPGGFYLATFTDRIDTVFSYKFDGQEAASYSGTYMVKGHIIASSDEKKGSDNQQEVWRKDFTFVPVKTFTGSGKEVLLTENLSIPYQSYRYFADQVRETTKYIPSEVNLNVEYIVTLTGQTSQGPLRETITSNLIISLEGAAFTIKGDLQQAKAGTLKKKVSVPVPGLKLLQVILSVLSALLLLMFLYILLFTRGEKEFVTPAEKECRELLKKHGDRIIVLKNGIPLRETDQIVNVASFEDILKAADELGQPILLEDPGTDQYLFYVRDGMLLYKFLLSKPINYTLVDESDDVAPVS